MAYTRMVRGMTQGQLGALTNRSQSAIGQYETGQSEPDIATFEVIAAALNCDACWLAFGHEDDGEAVAKPLPAGDKEDRLFAWAFHETTRLLAEEGLHGDLAFTFAYARKLVEATQRGKNDVETKKVVRRAIEEQRLEIRKGLDQFRNKMRKRQP